MGLSWWCCISFPGTLAVPREGPVLLARMFLRHFVNVRELEHRHDC